MEVSEKPNLGVIVKLVNRFTDHQHVTATKDNLIFFETGYINACITRAAKSGRLSEADLEVAKRWLDPTRSEIQRPKPKTLKHF